MILFILQCTSIIMLVESVRFCVLLDCEYLINVDFIPLPFMFGFPLNGIKKYLT